MQDQRDGDMDGVFDRPTVSAECDRGDDEEEPAWTRSRFLDGKVGKIVAGDFINGITDFSGRALIAAIHDFPVHVPADDDAGATGEVREADFEVVEAVDLFVDEGLGGHDAGPDGVGGGAQPEDEGGVFVEDGAQAGEGVGELGFGFFD